jgi:hypothetical protein
MVDNLSGRQVREYLAPLTGTTTTMPESSTDTDTQSDTYTNTRTQPQQKSYADYWNDSDFPSTPTNDSRRRSSTSRAAMRMSLASTRQAQTMSNADASKQPEKYYNFVRCTTKLRACVDTNVESATIRDKVAEDTGRNSIVTPPHMSLASPHFNNVKYVVLRPTEVSEDKPSTTSTTTPTVSDGNNDNLGLGRSSVISKKSFSERMLCVNDITCAGAAADTKSLISASPASPRKVILGFRKNISNDNLSRCFSEYSQGSTFSVWPKDNHTDISGANRSGGVGEPRSEDDEDDGSIVTDTTTSTITTQPFEARLVTLTPPAPGSVSWNIRNGRLCGLETSLTSVTSSPRSPRSNTSTPTSTPKSAAKPVLYSPRRMPFSPPSPTPHSFGNHRNSPCAASPLAISNAQLLSFEFIA